MGFLRHICGQEGTWSQLSARQSLASVATPPRGFACSQNIAPAFNSPTKLRLVGKKGLEPLTLAGLVPKTSAYTNSATCPFFSLCIHQGSNLGPYA